MKSRVMSIVVWVLNAVLAGWTIYFYLGDDDGPDSGMAKGIALFCIFLPLSIITLLLAILVVKHRVPIILSMVTMAAVISPVVVEWVGSAVHYRTADPADYQHLIGRPYEEAREELPADIGMAGGAYLFNGMSVHVDENGIITKIVPD